MRETNHLQIVTSGLHRTAGPYKIYDQVASAVDLLVVPTIGFSLLYGLVIVGLGRRRLIWVNVTANPTAEWIARQLTEAFPWDQAPRLLIRDRDGAYGVAFLTRLNAMGIRDHPIAPRSEDWRGNIHAGSWRTTPFYARS
jgi:hypothetical protein